MDHQYMLIVQLEQNVLATTVNRVDACASQLALYGRNRRPNQQSWKSNLYGKDPSTAHSMAQRAHDMFNLR
jgi:hypothetical protein